MSAPTRKPEARKKAYAVPKLVRYGDVRALTQSGTLAGTETMATMMRKPSDRAIKEKIVRIGLHPLGIGLYLFKYKAAYRDQYGHGRQIGVMADEVETVMPLAVSLSTQGHKVVDYAMLGVTPSAP